MSGYIGGIAPYLLRGVLVTVEITAAAGVFAFIIACLAGAARASKLRAVRLVAATYIEVFRGTSVFVQIYWVYFVLPLFGLSFSSFEAGIGILALNVGAYGSEVIRGAINAVDRGQRDACVALNLSAWTTARHIIFPQAFIRAIPPLGNLLIDLLKGTSLLSAISVVELTFAAKQQIFVRGHALEGYTCVMLLYLAIGIPIVILFRIWERRSTRHLDLGSTRKSARRIKILAKAQVTP